MSLNGGEQNFAGYLAVSWAGTLNTVSLVSKNVPPLACYNFDTREWILLFLAEVLTIK